MKWTNKGHQFDSWGNNFVNKEIMIYGAGMEGTKFLDKMRRWGLDGIIKGFVDRRAVDIQKHDGLTVYTPEEVIPKKNDNYILVVAMANSKNKKNIYDRLIRAGYIANINLFFPENFAINLNDVFLPVFALYAADRIVLSSSCVIPSTLCNLNCKHCLNFTPYIERFETRSIKALKEDIDNFFRVIDYVERYQISGGEPLLYPLLDELIVYIGENYRKQIGIFEIVLNGTIVPKDNICQLSKQYGLTMILDNYINSIPSNMNHRKEIIAQFDNFDLMWNDNTVQEWFNLDVDGTDNTEMTDCELQEYFDICNNPWHFYENGKFYACNFSRFAEKAGINSEPESSCFSIVNLKPEHRKDLLEFLLNYNKNGYVELCKHCSGWAECNSKRVPVAEQISRSK